MSEMGRYCCDRLISPDPAEHLIREKREHKIGFAVHHLDRMIGKAMHQQANEKGIDDMTMMNGWIIRFLYHHSDRDIFQKDIEKELQITKSSVTNIVQMMEQKGYITRTAVEGDARLKKIELTEAGIGVMEVLKSVFDESEKKLDECLSPSDQEQLLVLLGKLDDGLSADIGYKRKQNAAEAHNRT